MKCFLWDSQETYIWQFNSRHLCRVWNISKNEKRMSDSNWPKVKPFLKLILAEFVVTANPGFGTLLWSRADTGEFCRFLVLAEIEALAETKASTQRTKKPSQKTFEKLKTVFVQLSSFLMSLFKQVYLNTSFTSWWKNLLSTSPITSCLHTEGFFSLANNLIIFSWYMYKKNRQRLQRCAVWSYHRLYNVPSKGIVFAVLTGRDHKNATL